MIRWDKNNPLHREIMEANKEAIIRKEIARLQRELDEIERTLPRWLILLARLIAGWKLLLHIAKNALASVRLF